MAGLLNAILFELILGAPRVRLEWWQGGRIIPDRRPDLHLPNGHKRVMHVDVYFEGKSLTTTLFRRSLGNSNIVCDVVLLPPHALRLAKQSLEPDTTVNNNTVAIECGVVLLPGIQNSVEFSLQPTQQGSAPQSIDCHLRVRRADGRRFLTRALVRATCGVEGFTVGG